MKFVKKIPYALKRAVFRASPALARTLGLDFRLRVPSRMFMEQEVFKYVNQQFQRATTAPAARCLFIGLDKHNWHYDRLLDLDFYSIDLNPRNAAYGPPGRHVVGSATELSSYYPPNSFDVVFANGLIGFGLDTEEAFNQLMFESHRVLASDGMLVLGYNDKPNRLSFKVEQAAGFEAFKTFEPGITGMTGARHIVEDGFRHCYVFLRPRRMGYAAGQMDLVAAA
ncbi:methyltransferase domain-containing protein [Achromobacter aegrifaciens]|uniref:class I SAM-dependent methyltransferase n=1 Tax=Achromobacter aegrifaciens TaxID=1287736 RepID=UPI0027B8A696|nr:methyltransferase domain-containing protein [Achromobacter aegrifaciens]WLW64082.1 methyltransferase domain-containing protein [Achromobacter aegrifaciens]